MRAVDLAPLFGNRDDRLALPVQQGVQRHVRAGLGIIEPAEFGAHAAADQPGVLQAEGGRRAPRRAPSNAAGVLDQGQQPGLDGRIHPGRDWAGGQSPRDFPWCR
jgi:hypothetical protein